MLKNMLTPMDARRRWFGSMFLLLGLGLLIWGMTWLSDYLVKHPLMFVIYWASCALCTGLALINALLDMMIMRKRTREEQISLAEKSFGDLDSKGKKGE